ncbi:hypothetical protein N665_0513s0028 [Sinapis alba]|nr:hypothetical protein N665_0513s0028 [Sinapis alba]
MRSGVVSLLEKCPNAAGDSLKRKNIEEKRQLVHELCIDSDSAFDTLKKWDREELVQVLCAESGEKGNNSKWSKDQIINKLLKVKQLLIATETMSVEVLCSRLVLAQKLLKGTEKYTKLSETVEEAVKCLETELCGSLTDLSSTNRRGNVNRLASAPKVKALCSSALESLLDDPLPVEMQGSTKIRFEDVDATSLTLILGGSEEETSSPGNFIHYRVLHRKGSEKDYTETCALMSPETRFVVSGLTPDTEYCFKVFSFRGLKETSVEETKISTKPSQEEEGEPTSGTQEKQLALKETVLEEVVSVSNGKSFELEDCVRVLRQLELSGYVETNFRLKFLTWYGLHANADKKNLVKALVNEMDKHPTDLAEQLIQTFSNLI